KSMSGLTIPGRTRIRLRSRSTSTGSSRPEEERMAHVHGQDHDHPSHEGVIAVQEGPLTHYQVMETALRELLIEKGVFTTEDVRVHDSTADMRYMVMPMRPVGTEEWGDDALAELVTRDSLIGVARAVEPA